MIKNGFAIKPSYELRPDYKISPFSNKDMMFNRTLGQSDEIDRYFEQRFGHSRFFYTDCGRQALGLALASFRLCKNDCVTILTTSGNYYISGCVTQEIEKVCRWSRSFESKTRLIFINHEFGYPFKGWEKLLNHQLPIIEDCAHSFFTADANIGKKGDYAIYSFPKIFPIQYGGLLVSNTKNNETKSHVLESVKLEYLKNVLSYHIKKKKTIIELRRNNHDKLKKLLTTIGACPRFELEKEVVPGVFLFKLDMTEHHLVSLKQYLYAHGIECSVFYGESAFFIPVHQNLQKVDLDYFATVIQTYVGEHVNSIKQS